MNDAASLSGRPTRTLRVEGQEYPVYPLSFSDLGDLQAWVNDQFTDPLQTVREHLGDGLSMAQEQFLLKSALEIASRPKALIGTPEADRLLVSAEGVREILYLSIRKGRPDFTRDDAARLVDKLDKFELAAAIGSTQVTGATGDPKADASAGDEAAPTQATSPRSTSGESTTGR